MFFRSFIFGLQSLHQHFAFEEFRKGFFKDSINEFVIKGSQRVKWNPQYSQQYFIHLDIIWSSRFKFNIFFPKSLGRIIQPNTFWSFFEYTVKVEKRINKKNKKLFFFFTILWCYLFHYVPTNNSNNKSKCQQSISLLWLLFDKCWVIYLESQNCFQKKHISPNKHNKRDILEETYHRFFLFVLYHSIIKKVKKCYSFFVEKWNYFAFCSIIWRRSVQVSNAAGLLVTISKYFCSLVWGCFSSILNKSLCCEKKRNQFFFFYF